MGNKNASIYLASPATVAISAVNGVITSPGAGSGKNRYPFKKKQTKTIEIAPDEKRKTGKVWDYHDVDNLNTDQMFAGKLTYEISSAEPERIIQHLFEDFDKRFADEVEAGDVIIAGNNFGCGSSREHPSVGLVHAGVKAVIAKSVSRIFFRSALNQGLLVLVLPKVVEHYNSGDNLFVDLSQHQIIINERKFEFSPLPRKLMEILESGGLVNWIKVKDQHLENIL
jgi:3-isopropylmalate dehydratase small subunit